MNAMNWVSLQEIIANSEYHSGASNFKKSFAHEWQDARKSVFKYESPQDMGEVENDSWRALMAGDWDKSISLIRAARAADAELYALLNSHNVKITRCRPFNEPLSLYTQWEIQNYFINLEFGEDIFLTATKNVQKLIKTYAYTDFLVFDNKTAYMTDLDKNGKMVGGWSTHNAHYVNSLAEVFKSIQANSQPLIELFQKDCLI